MLCFPTCRFRRWGWAVSRGVTALHVLFLTLLVLPAALPLFAPPASASLLQAFNMQLLAVFVAGALVRPLALQPEPATLDVTVATVGTAVRAIRVRAIVGLHLVWRPSTMMSTPLFQHALFCLGSHRLPGNRNKPLDVCTLFCGAVRHPSQCATAESCGCRNDRRGAWRSSSPARSRSS